MYTYIDFIQVVPSINFAGLTFFEKMKMKSKLKNKCDVCHQALLCYWDFKSHDDVHSGRLKIPLQCPECLRLFKVPKWFDRHMLTHSDISSFTCMLCSDRFSKLTDFLPHVATHVKEMNLQVTYQHFSTFYEIS